MVTVLYQFNLVQFSFDNKNLKKKLEQILYQKSSFK